MNNTQYDIPNISVDVVPAVYSPSEGKVGVVLGKRIYEPHLGHYALPGVLLQGSERLDEAAYRALETKTQLPLTSVLTLADLGTFDNPNRDPRGATVSIAKLAVVCLDEVEDKNSRQFLPITDAVRKDLPFDHANIIRFAAAAMEERFMKNREFTRALLGEQFATGTVKAIAKQLHEASGSEDLQLDFSNLGRILKYSGWVVPSQSTSLSSTGRGRPSVLWEWVN